MCHAKIAHGSYNKTQWVGKFLGGNQKEQVELQLFSSQAIGNKDIIKQYNFMTVHG